MEKIMNNHNPMHVPVLLEAVVRNALPENGKIFADCTFGLGGHTKAILEEYPQITKVFAVDRDAEILNYSIDKNPDPRIARFQAKASELPEVLEHTGCKGADGILLDLGVSSYQLDSSERGFSFMRSGPLDMRMDKRDKITAENIVNTYEKSELEHIFFEYGEEKFSRQIAKNIEDEISAMRRVGKKAWPWYVKIENGLLNENQQQAYAKKYGADWKVKAAKTILGSEETFNNTPRCIWVSDGIFTYRPGISIPPVKSRRGMTFSLGIGTGGIHFKGNTRGAHDMGFVNRQQLSNQFDATIKQNSILLQQAIDNASSHRGHLATIPQTTLKTTISYAPSSKTYSGRLADNAVEVQRLKAVIAESNRKTQERRQTLDAFLNDQK
ncbi:16S rRNA (cytosine(1402)-N(4))-methyltransferase, partial [bacterium]|nr:16S rRNA (cytosine(1402)-N(4))-methyltransferase [bacterium]